MRSYQETAIKVLVILFIKVLGKINSIPIISSFSTTFMIKGLLTIGSILLSLIVSNLFGSDVFGEFVLFQITILGICILAMFGVNETLVLFVSREDRELVIFKYLIWSFCISLSLTAFLLFLINYFLMEITEVLNFFFLPKFINYINISTPLFVLSYVMSGFFKGGAKPVKASLLENGAISVLCSLVVVVLYSFVTLDEVVVLGCAYFISSLFVFIFGIYSIASVYFLTKKEEINSDPCKHKFKSFGSSSFYFFIMSLTSFSQTVLILLVVAFMLSEKDAGILRLTQQLAVLITFPLIVLNTILPRQFSKLFSVGNIKGIESLAQKSSLFLSLLSLPIVTFCILFPNLIIGLFGEGFDNADIVLQILIFGQFFNVYTASVASILKMSGLEKALSAIVLICGFFIITSTLYFLPLYGLYAVAIILSGAIILQNSVVIFIVTKKLNIIPVYIPWRINKQ
jgi:O-antigen/teichoic acid export membrane protein